MSKTKDKKLKKLRKQKIVPYILGILLALLVFLALSVSIFAFFIVNLVYGKVQVSYDNSMHIAKYIEQEWDDKDVSTLQEVCENALRLTPNTEEICITDSKSKFIYQLGGNIPNWNFVVPEFSDDNVTLIMTDDKESLIYAKDGTAHIRLEKILDINVVMQAAEKFNDGKSWDENNICTVSMWYEIPILDDAYSVCVKNAMPINATEIFFASTMIGIIVILVIILVIYYIVSVTSLVHERRKLATILETDIVTGGFNLQYFIRSGTHILKKKKSDYAVILIRMEKYRNFCYCYGIHEGEELMETLYLTMKKGLQKKEILAHGEKADFALLLSYTTEEELADRIHMMIAEMEKVRARQRLYFSVGIYKANDINISIDAMYNYAGVAISRLADDSENRTVWYDDEMKYQELWKRKVENDMERALVNREFKVYLQPKYSTRGEKLSGAEALVRWIHPTEGFIAPYRFIPFFEKNGFIIHLDDYMVREVAKLQARWIEDGKDVVPISVNISRVHFAREDLAEHLCRIVDEYKVPHHLIELELTESAFYDDKEVLLSTLNKLKSYGFEISMDDFGSGYSSLNSLKELPLDVLKLDAGFFREDDSNGRGRLIVGDTIALAKKLDMRIVAEGIETREQVDFLASMDCDLIQGYYFAKPMPVIQFEEKAFKK